MTPNEFNQLTFEEKDSLLFEKGIKIRSIEQEWHDVDLYSLEDFFVEYSMPRDHDADDIHAFETQQESERYKEFLSKDDIKN